MFWGATKKYTRKHCTYSFKDLERIIPIALKATSLVTLRRFARKSFRYMDAYRDKNGIFLTQSQIEYAMKKYTSHRSIPKPEGFYTQRTIIYTEVYINANSFLFTLAPIITFVVSLAS
jgi:hypothetical protein